MGQAERDDDSFWSGPSEPVGEMPKKDVEAEIDPDQAGDREMRVVYRAMKPPGGYDQPRVARRERQRLGLQPPAVRDDTRGDRERRDRDDCRHGE
jgi:hypothetical protein